MSSGCVLPLAPEFVDPPLAPNLSPVILSSSPVEGEIVSTKTFSVVVSDPNSQDRLWVRWIADYPPHTADSQIMGSDMMVFPAAGWTQQGPGQSVGFNVECERYSLAALDRNRIYFAVSDRPFRQPDSQPQNDDYKFTAVPPDAKMVTVTWVLEPGCM
jgi:hypothetical protein